MMRFSLVVIECMRVITSLIWKIQNYLLFPIFNIYSAITACCFGSLLSFVLKVLRTASVV